MLAQIPGGKQDARKFGFRGAGWQTDNHPFQLAALDALEYLGHDVMVPALDKLGPYLAHEGQEVLTRFFRIAGIGANKLGPHRTHEGKEMPRLFRIGLTSAQ